MKVIRKAHIIREKKIPYVTREKEILAMTNHPFIVKLYFTFQDKENLCIFSSYICLFIYCTVKRIKGSYKFVVLFVFI